MATYIEMPKLSDTMTEGTLLKWHVKEGAKVSTGDVLADVETDKATMEMESFDDGILGKIYVKDGEKAPLGAYLAVLVEEGEEVPDAAPSNPKVAAAAPAEDKKKPAGGGKAAPAAASSSQAPVAARTSSGRVKASPLARKLAEQRGLDLVYLQGTGPGGRIVKRDVETARDAPAASGGTGGPAVQAIRPTMDFDPGAKRQALSGMRKIIADRLLVSKSTIPHFYLNVELDAAPLLAMRKQVNDGITEGDHKFTINDFILKAVVLAAQEVPAVNAAFDVDAIIQYANVNLAVAIAVPDGLVTPVIRAAQDKTILEISKAVKDLAARAKTKKLSPDEFAAGTITVSSLGAYGIDSFDAIINPPQAAIVSISAIRAVPVVNAANEVVPGQRMWVGMSCDHRVIDGAAGATYLQALRKFIENPALMLV